MRSAEVDSGLPANVTFHSAHATAFQIAAAVTGGYRARYPLPGQGSFERDGIYVAMDYHYLRGIRLRYLTDTFGRRHTVRTPLLKGLDLQLDGVFPA